MKASRILDGKLKSYELSTEGYLITRQQSDGESKHPSWTAYAAVAGSALAMAGQADAIILYSGANQNVTIERTTSATSFTSVKPISVNYAGTSMAIADLFLVANSSAGTGGGVIFNYYGGSFLIAPIISAASTTTYGQLKKFSSGDDIGAALGINSGVGLLGVGAGSVFGLSGPWNPGETAFAGLVGFTSATGGAARVRGWIRLSFESDTALTSDGLINRVTAIDWAIGDEPIKAGQTVSADIPEPATLGLLALGAAGMGAMRRRRKMAEASVH